MAGRLVGATLAILASLAALGIAALGDQGCALVPDGVVSWWPGEGSGEDIIGENDVLLFNGASYAAGRVGLAFDLSAANAIALVQTPSNLLGGVGDFTICLWVMRQSAADFGGLVCIGDVERQQSGTGWIVAIQLNQGGNIRFQFSNEDEPSGSGEHNELLNSTFANDPNLVDVDGDWHHVAVVRRSDKMEIHIDGEMQSDKACTTAPLTGLAGPCVFGAWYDTGDDGSGDPSIQEDATFDGLIDEVTMWNVALTPMQIAAMYQSSAAGMCMPASEVCDCGNPIDLQVVELRESASLLLYMTRDGSPVDVAAFDSFEVARSTYSAPLTFTSFQSGSSPSDGTYALGNLGGGFYVLEFDRSDFDAAMCFEIRVMRLLPLAPPASGATLYEKK